VVGNAKGGVVGVLVGWVTVVQGVTTVAAVVQGVTIVATVVRGAVIGVTSSAVIGTTSSWVNRRYSKGPTGTLLDSSRLCILGSLIAVG
jgi:hypothetical protein